MKLYGINLFYFQFFETLCKSLSLFAKKNYLKNPSGDFQKSGIHRKTAYTLDQPNILSLSSIFNQLELSFKNTQKRTSIHGCITEKDRIVILAMFNKGCQFAMQEVVFVGKLIAGFLGLLCLGMVILWIFITIKLIDHKHILTKEIDEKLDEDSEDDEQEIDVEHLKMD